MKMFALCDTKAKIFHRPFCDESVAAALRGFEILVNDPKSQMINRFPDDFSLFTIGEFDPQTGTLTPTLDNLGSARTVLRSDGGSSAMPAQPPARLADV
nr:MAG: nonstructural protein [Microvirus sp.]